jgi:hypothetical protein
MGKRLGPVSLQKVIAEERDYLIDMMFDHKRDIMMQYVINQKLDAQQEQQRK